MNVSINQDLANFVREKVAVGRYRSASEAINDGLRLLKGEDELEFDRLRDVLRQRISEDKRSDAVLFDVSVTEGIKRRGIQRLSAIRRPGRLSSYVQERR